MSISIKVKGLGVFVGICQLPTDLAGINEPRVLSMCGMAALRELFKEYEKATTTIQSEGKN